MIEMTLCNYITKKPHTFLPDFLWTLDFGLQLPCCEEAPAVLRRGPRREELKTLPTVLASQSLNKLSYSVWNRDKPFLPRHGQMSNL